MHWTCHPLITILAPPQVTLCPPADCARSQCREHVSKQPAACGVDTVNGDVGSTFTLRMVVFNSRGLNATVGELARVLCVLGSGMHVRHHACLNT